MDTDSRHQFIKKKLELLGYSQTLPVAAISLVSSLIDDLIQTSESLKVAKDEIQELEEQKHAWELVVEPYKCDNSKLLSECNKLKLDLLNSEKKIQIENSDLKKKLRNLESDKKHLDEKCLQLSTQIYQYATSDKIKHKFGDFKAEKPFISTVKSNTLFPHPAFIESVKGKCHGTAHLNKTSGIYKELEKLKSEIKYSEDVISILKKQEAEKDREIQRLNCLFTGGRPVSAIAKDCCYKNVAKITEDVGIMQRDKVGLQKKLSESLEQNEKLFVKYKSLKDKNTTLEEYLKEIGDAAMFVEREANLKIKNQNKEILDLKECLIKCSDVKTEHDTKGYKKTIKTKNLNEEKMLFEIEYYKSKLKEAEKVTSAKNSDLYAELIKERDEYQAKVQSIPKVTFNRENNCDVSKLYNQLKQKEMCIQRLNAEATELKNELERAQHERRSHHSMSVVNTIQRIERERDAAITKASTLHFECDALKEKLRVLNDSKICESRRVMEMEEKLSQLECLNQELQFSKTPAVHTIKRLREENCDIQIKLKNSDEDYKKLNVSYSQLKLLNQQTENVLMDSQAQLEFAKCDAADKDSQMACMNKTIDKLHDEMQKLSEEIRLLKTSKCNVEREKDYYMQTLDKKCEKMQSIESRMECVAQLKEDNRMLKIKTDDMSRELHKLESSNCAMNGENKCLSKQLEKTKHHLTNAVHENSRMADELGTITAELNQTRKCLNESQKESENIRSKLQSYIHEIERIDGLIAIKDNERKSALMQYKEIECHNMQLKEKFENVEQESSESKKLLSEYQHNVIEYRELIHAREIDIETLEKQVIDLSTEIEILRSDNTKIQIDLEAQRELCDKLDIQKEKLEAELAEYRMCTKDLCAKNDKLRDQIQQSRGNSGGGGDADNFVSSYHPTM